MASEGKAKTTEAEAKTTATYLVTGGNDGIGFGVVQQLAEAGAKVFLGARSIEKANTAIQKLDESLRSKVTPVQLDINDLESVNKAVATVKAAGGLDVLVNNAAVGGLEKPEDQHPATLPLDLKLVREIFETNFFGTVQVTTAFLPLLQASSRPAIVMVSHEGGSTTKMTTAIGHPESFLTHIQWVGYSGSKAALHSYLVGLATVFPKIRVNAVTPGYTATKLNGYGAHHPGARTIPQGAASIVRIAVHEPDGPTGKFFSPEGELLPW